MSSGSASASTAASSGWVTRRSTAALSTLRRSTGSRSSSSTSKSSSTTSAGGPPDSSSCGCRASASASSSSASGWPRPCRTTFAAASVGRPRRSTSRRASASSIGPTTSSASQLPPARRRAPRHVGRPASDDHGRQVGGQRDQEVVAQPRRRAGSGVRSCRRRACRRPRGRARRRRPRAIAMSRAGRARAASADRKPAGVGSKPRPSRMSARWSSAAAAPTTVVDLPMPPGPETKTTAGPLAAAQQAPQRGELPLPADDARGGGAAQPVPNLHVVDATARAGRWGAVAPSASVECGASARCASVAGIGPCHSRRSPGVVLLP